MNDKQDQLIAKYPNLFRELKHLECNDGWINLIDHLCAIIEDHIERVPGEIRGELYAVQVKEKFGGLRFYMHEYTPYITGAINLAESLSFDICEDCGEPGERRHGGWIRTQCDTHAEETRVRREREHQEYLDKQRELGEDPDEEEDY